MTPVQKGHAVVSGLGPNGVAATLCLLNGGYKVTAIEKRPDYTRPIHLLLRSTYLNDLRGLSPQLHEKLMEITTPIIENSRTHHRPNQAVPGHIERWFTYFAQIFRSTPEEKQRGQGCPIWARLLTPPQRHVRLDNAERLFFDYLENLSLQSQGRFAIRRGFQTTLHQVQAHYHRVVLHPGPEQSQQHQQELGIPELVVLAEGGKSTTLQQLGLHTVRFSYPKYFMSAHISVPFGPRTRRIDTDVRQLCLDPSVVPADISLWASGHGDSAEGTWIVIEVPEALLSQDPQQAEDYFVRGALLLCQGDGNSPEQLTQKVRQALQKGAILSQKRGRPVPGIEAAEKTPFAGTFKFEQQCLRHPAVGHNVIVLGDAAGMGHHALSSGLEMGACDLGPLSVLARRLQKGDGPEDCLAEYAEAVFRSRIKLLGLGMSEYYPNLPSDKLEMLHRAADIFGADPN